MPDRDRINPCIGLDRMSNGHIVFVDCSGDTPLGLRVHRGERDAMIRILMARSCGVTIWPERRCLFNHNMHTEAERLVVALRMRLYRTASKPLSPQQIEAILAITSRECILWGKNGRLPVSGAATIRKGETRISLWTYPCHEIERLAGAPASIREWRTFDAMRIQVGFDENLS
jgi:hypothetical protein